MDESFKREFLFCDFTKPQLQTEIKENLRKNKTIRIKKKNSLR